MTKKLVSAPILAHMAQILAAKFSFSKIWLRQSLDIMVSYHHVQYQKKLMIQSWENLLTDGQTDQSDFIGRCLTNVKRPINKWIKKKKISKNIKVSKVLVCLVCSGSFHSTLKNKLAHTSLNNGKINHH